MAGPQALPSNGPFLSSKSPVQAPLQEKRWANSAHNIKKN